MTVLERLRQVADAQRVNDYRPVNQRTDAETKSGVEAAKDSYNWWLSRIAEAQQNNKRKVEIAMGIEHINYQAAYDYTLQTLLGEPFTVGSMCKGRFVYW